MARGSILLLLAACRFEGSEQLGDDAPNPSDPDAPGPIDASSLDGSEGADGATPDGASVQPCPDDSGLLVCFSFDQRPLPVVVGNEGVALTVAASLVGTSEAQRGASGAVGVGALSNIVVPASLELVGIRSVDAWYYVGAISGTGRIGFLDASGGNPTLTLFYHYMGNVGRELRFDIGVGADKLVLPANLGEGAWHHVAQVCESSGVLVGYLDGVELGRSADSRCSPSSIGTAGLFIGQDNNAGFPADRLSGAIDDVRLWTRALTPAEICAAASASGC